MLAIYREVKYKKEIITFLIYATPTVNCNILSLDDPDSLNRWWYNIYENRIRSVHIFHPSVRHDSGKTMFTKKYCYHLWPSYSPTPKIYKTTTETRIKYEVFTVCLCKWHEIDEKILELSDNYTVILKCQRLTNISAKQSSSPINWS